MKRKDHRRRRGPEAGFTMIEVLCCGVVLALALLGHAASTVSEHQMAEASRYRSLALQAAGQFMERLRADEFFVTSPGNLGLFERIRDRQLVTSSPDGTPLDNGLLAYAPSVYCADLVLPLCDFVLPRGLDDLVVRVEVPLATTGAPVLREDLAAPFFGLPGDLNGDGVIDDQPRDLDYLALPVVLTFRWTAPGHAPTELRLASWLHGRR